MQKKLYIGTNTKMYKTIRQTVAFLDRLGSLTRAMGLTWDQGLLPMLQAAEKAAAQGVEDTKQYQARYGRAKSLMERSVGFQDAGATSVWIIIRSMREFVEQQGSV